LPVSARTKRRLHIALALSALLGLLACGDDASPPGVGTGNDDAGDAEVDGAMPGPDGSMFDADVILPPEDAGPDAMIIEPPLGDDAEVRFCEEDCAALETECRTAFCDIATLECKTEPKQDGRACGSQELSTCTAPDTCSDGVCEPHHQAEDTACGDQDHACRLDDACDGEGQCQDNGTREVGTPCGDSSTSTCDGADSCNAQGECDDNLAEADAPCGDQGVLCRYDDVCDGNGSCVDQGSWIPGACPADREISAVDGRCGCGRPSGSSACMPGPDVCVDDECVPGHEYYAPVGLTTTNGMACGSPANTQCDDPDTCVEGFCETNAEPEDTACGSSTATACNLADSCDGFGNCRTNLLEVNTTCGTAPGPCFEPPRCNEVGLCTAGSVSPPDVPCGDSTIGECDDADACDGAGNCVDNLALLNTPCGDESSGECDADDSCNSTGQCIDRVVTPGTVCGEVGGECASPGACSAQGTCVGAMNELPGTPCGDDSESDCDLADSCDGEGECVLNYVDEGEACGGTAPMCFEASQCNGAGSCEDGDAIPSCEVQLTVVVTDQVTSAPLSGVVVSVVGASPAESGTTDANGEVELDVTPNAVVNLSFASTATHWGLRTMVVVPTGVTMVSVPLLSDAAVDARYAAAGLDAIDSGSGILENLFFTGGNPNGGEAAEIDPSCATASCGPIALNAMGQYELSDTTVPGGFLAYLSFVNVPPGVPQVSVSGAPAVNACEIIAGQATPTIIARTITQLSVSCTTLE
jgi:hypothetical protein